MKSHTLTISITVTHLQFSDCIIQSLSAFSVSVTTFTVEIIPI